MHNVEKFGCLKCPVCGGTLSFEGGSLACDGARRHNFDRARSGYVNLNTHSSTSGDDKAMALARQSFLRKGHYSEFAEKIAAAAGSGELLLDAGCGEGYYTEICASNFSSAVGIDLSKHALDLAAKSAKQKGLADSIFYAAESVYTLPIKSGSADCIINVFAPCVEEEYLRVLKDGGRLVVAAAGREHLSGLKAALYESVTENEERRDYPKNMRLADTVHVKCNVTLHGEDIWQLFTMTPYYYRTQKSASERLASLDTLDTLLDFEIRTYVK